MYFKKNIIIILTIMVIAAPAILEAEWSVSDESILGTDLSIGYMENELIIEKDFNWHGFYAGFENTFIMDNFRSIDFMDEISIGFGLGLTDWLTLSIYQKMFISAVGAEFGVDFMTVFGHEIENKGFTIEDENEFVYNTTANKWEYVNTLGIDWQPIEIGDSLSFGFFFEDEIVIPIEKSTEPENGILIGPIISNAHFSFGLYYALGLAMKEDASHGIEASLIFNL